MGGAAAGETASKIAKDTLREVVEDVREEGLNAAKLVSAFHEANRRIKAASKADSKLEGMGTTMVAAIEDQRQVLIGSVGDSRVYRFEGGELKLITEDQTWINEIGRRLGLPDATLKVHPMRHVLTMALGVSDQLQVHSYSLTLESGTVLLLCSDGLHGPVTDQEIADILGRGGSLETRAKLLIDTAKAHGGPDNVTVVLLQP
jgi:protein phosphatase